MIDSKFVQSLIVKTQNREIIWEETATPYEFMLDYEGGLYSIQHKNEEYLFHFWTPEGQISKTIKSTQSAFHISVLSSLFHSILLSDINLNTTFNKYINRNMNSEKESMNKAISLYKVMKRLGYESSDERPKISLKSSESFYYIKESNPLYVEPPMSQLRTSVGMTDLSEAEVVLISAPGATGKSAMSEYLSNKLDIPILNLSKHEAVGANSISGVIMRKVDEKDVFQFHAGMRSGKCSMIIDGLDEAFIRISQGSIEAFLKDLAFFSKGALGLPFVILGRTAITDETVLELEDLGVKVAHLQIEPFTIDKAYQFIDNHINENLRTNYSTYYRDVRNYIIEQIGGFFKNESDMNRHIFQRFIGYAPVLQSIVTLLKDNGDFHKLLEDLKKSQKQKIDLLIDVVERILTRETDKIREEVLSALFDSKSPENFKTKIYSKAGSIEEQCIRILYYSLRKPTSFCISEEAVFDERYNERMNNWIVGHPFLDKDSHTIHNVVFESYVIAKLIGEKIYKNDVLDYLSRTKSNSYLLLDIYVALQNGESNEIDYRLFPYLYASFKSLDHPEDIGITEILSDEEDDDSVADIHCSLNFSRIVGDMEHELSFTINKNITFAIPADISAFTFDAPLNLKTVSHKTDIHSPSTFCCRSFKMSSKDLVLNIHDESPIIIECSKFEGLTEKGDFPTVTNRTKSKIPLKIITDSSVVYPFNEYKSQGVKDVSTSRETIDMYKKLRRMILMFRSHSKGTLARFKSKIDNRIGNTPMGSAIIDALLKNKIIYEGNFMYFIDADKQAELLGLKYDDIRSCEMNSKTIAFLQTIHYK